MTTLWSAELSVEVCDSSSSVHHRHSQQTDCIYDLTLGHTWIINLEVFFLSPQEVIDLRQGHGGSSPWRSALRIYICSLLLLSWSLWPVNISVYVSIVLKPLTSGSRGWITNALSITQRKTALSICSHTTASWVKGALQRPGGGNVIEASACTQQQQH